MNNNDELQKKYGVYITFGLAEAWPELVGLLNRIFVDRVATIPWVPSEWLQEVQLLQASEGGLIRIAPAYVEGGKTNRLAPDWLDSQEKLDAWQGIFTRTNEAVQAFAQGKATDGRTLLAQAYADSAFWNNAYSIAVAIRDIPSNAIGALIGGAEDVAGGIAGKIFKSWLVWLAVGLVVLVAIWKLGLFRSKA